MRVDLQLLNMRFSNLDEGDVFALGDDLFMKIERPEGQAVNAVDLEDGSLSVMEKSLEVLHFPNAVVKVEQLDPDDDDDDDEDED